MNSLFQLPRWVRRSFLSSLLSIFLVLTILVTSSSGVFTASNADENLLQIDYGEGAADVINIRLDNVRVLENGNIAANIYIENLKSVVYDMTWEAYGEASVDPYDWTELDESFFLPLMAKRTWPAEGGSASLILEPGSSMKINFDKFGHSTSDALASLGLDLCNMFILFSLGDFAPTVPSELMPSVGSSLVGLLENAGFDTALFTLKLAEEDYWGALGQLGSVIVDIPDAFAKWVLDNLGVAVSSETLTSIGKWLKAAPVLPVVYDIFAAPKHADVTIRAVSSHEGSADVVLVVDRSGSMTSTKMTGAKEAAKQFVDLMQEDDQVGVVSFNSNAYVVFPLTKIVEEQNTRTQAKTAIDSIYASGSTSIGDGLRYGLNQLLAYGDPTHVHAIVLLSDGQENASEYVSTVLPDLIAAKVIVHTIGLGSDADVNLLQEIADKTGGVFTFTPDPQELAEIYAMLFADVSGLSTVTELVGEIAQGETKSQSVVLSGLDVDPLFSLNWPGSELALTLTTPSGTIIDPEKAATTPGIYYAEGATYSLYRIIGDAEAGSWKVNVTGVDTGGVNEPYALSVRARSEIRTELYVSPSPAQPGTRELLTTYVHDNKGGIDGATIQAQVSFPDSTVVNVPMLEDPDRPTGFYHMILGDTDLLGTYDVKATISGNSNQGSKFSRVAYTSFLIREVSSPAANIWISIVGDSVKGNGRTIEYDFFYGNAGPDRAEDVGLTIDLPEAAAGVSSSLGEIIDLPENKGEGWSIGDLESGEARLASVSLSLSQDTQVGDVITTTAQIHLQVNQLIPDIADSFPENNEAWINTQIDYNYIYLPGVQRLAN